MAGTWSMRSYLAGSWSMMVNCWWYFGYKWATQPVLCLVMRSYMAGTWSTDGTKENEGLQLVVNTSERPQMVLMALLAMPVLKQGLMELYVA